ncbi:MAG: isoaspartyl peptidase/L-asparaginase [Anaerolineae bacterium]
MSGKKYIVLAHGGAGANEDHSDGTEKAARRGVEELKAGAPVLLSVCRAVTVLEDDSRYNAGLGSRRRSDETIRMDASCMDSHNRFGAVALLEGFRNPVEVAYAVSQSRYRFLGGEGAGQFAREQNAIVLNPADIRSKSDIPSSSDTVGCVAFDNENFAAALSTGGTEDSHPGRVGDVPIIGGGLYAGSNGAVAVTGIGEEIFMRMTAYRAYQMIEQDESPENIVEAVLSWFDHSVDIGIILVSRQGYAGGANRPMPWSVVKEG